MRRFAALSAAALAFAAAPVSAQNLLSTGSFEDPALAPGTTFTTIMNGGTIGAWSVTAGSVDLIRSYWAPADGFQSLDLNGSSFGSIAQTVGTSNGGRYTLTFAMGGNTDSQADKVMRVWWGSQDLGVFTFAQAGNTRTNMNYRTVTLAGLIAGSASTTLRFEGAGTTPFNGVALDNVNITQDIVPEPSMLLLMATGMLGALGIVARRRRSLAAAIARTDA